MGGAPLWVTVGFVGHRAIDDAQQVADGLDLAFTCVSQALDQLGALATGFTDPRTGTPETLGEAYEGGLHARLLSGCAPGADRLAIRSWRAHGPGPVHALIPYRDPTTGDALTDSPDRAGPDEIVSDLATFDAWSGLAGDELGLPPDGAHAEVGRWIVRHSEVLVALWNGEAPKGPGGTGDVVRRALERGLPVIWIQPGARDLRVLCMQEFHRRAEIDEVLADLVTHATPATPESLAELMFAHLAPPHAPTAEHAKHKHSLDPEAAGRMDYARHDPLAPKSAWRRLCDPVLDAWVWSLFGIFRRAVGGLRLWTPPDVGRPPEPPSLHADTAFAGLSAAFAVADARANRLSAVHRSEQLILAVMAVLAVMAGALPALAHGDVEHSHLIAACLEFGLGLLAFLVVMLAKRAHRHRRWSDARRLAERLRATLALWPLGVDLADDRLTTPHTWTEWRARALLRAAGPPRGWLDHATLVERSRWGAYELIAGQIVYHAKESHAAEKIDQRIEHVEQGVFFLLMALLLVFLLAHRVSHELVEALQPWVVVTGTVAPAVGAAGLAMRATNGFAELARRSANLLPEYLRLQAEFRDALANSLALRHAQQILRDAAQMLVEDADSWRDRLVSRKTERGG